MKEAKSEWSPWQKLDELADQLDALCGEMAEMSDCASKRNQEDNATDELMSTTRDLRATAEEPLRTMRQASSADWLSM